MFKKEHLHTLTFIQNMNNTFESINKYVYFLDEARTIYGKYSYL